MVTDQKIWWLPPHPRVRMTRSIWRSLGMISQGCAFPTWLHKRTAGELESGNGSYGCCPACCLVVTVFGRVILIEQS